MAQTTWITRRLQDAANAAYRAGLLPLFEDDDEVVSLRRPGDDKEVGCMADGEIGGLSLYTDVLIDADRDRYAWYCGLPAVLTSLDAYGCTGSLHVRRACESDGDGDGDEVFV